MENKRLHQTAYHSSRILLSFLALVCFLFKQALNACVSEPTTPAVGHIVSYHVFDGTNQLGIIDVEGNYFKFSPQGSSLSNSHERLNLPLTPISQRRLQLISAFFAPAHDRIFIFGDYKKALTYHGGSLTELSSPSDLASSNAPFFYQLNDCLLYHGQRSIMVWQAKKNPSPAPPSEPKFYSNAQKMTFTRFQTNSPDTYYELDSMKLNGRSINRVTNEVCLSLMGIKGLCFQTILNPDTAIRSIIPHALPSSDTAIQTIFTTNTPSELLISSIGTSSDHFAYITYDNSRTNRMLLTIRSKANHGKKGSYSIEGLLITSVALHPTQNIIYLFTSEGQLYTTTYTVHTSSITISSSLIEVGEGRFHGYSELHILKNDLLAIKKDIIIKILKLPSGTSTSHTILHDIDRPAFGRDVLGVPNLLLLLTPYKSLEKYRTDTHTRTSLITGLVKEVVCNPDPSKQRFYVLFMDKISVYSTTSMNLVKSVTYNDLQSSMAGWGLTSLERIYDLDIMKVKTSRLALLAFGKISSSKRAMVFVLNENTLNFHALLKLRKRSCGTIFASKKTNTGISEDVLWVKCPNHDYMIFYDYSTDNFPSSNAYITLQRTAQYSSQRNPYDNIRLYFWDGGHTSKTQVKQISTGSAMITWVTPYRMNSLVITYSDPGKLGVSFQQSFEHIYIFEKVEGPLFNNEFYIYNAFRLIRLYPDNSSPNKVGISQMFNANLKLGSSIGYVNADNTIHITDGESRVELSQTDCYKTGLADNKLEYLSRNSIPDCQTINFFNMTDCKLCTASRFVRHITQGTECVTYCNPLYQEGDKCVKACSLGLFKKDAYYYYCAEKSGCSSGSSRTFGDRCITQWSCPIGTSLSSDHSCEVPAPSTSHIKHNLPFETTSTSSCPAGTLLWVHYNQCTPHTADHLPTGNYKATSDRIYCDANTHFFDITSQKCIPACDPPKFLGMDNSSEGMGAFCATSSECSSLSMVTDSTNPSTLLCHKVVCNPPDLKKSSPSFTCVTQTQCKDANYFIQLTDHKCLSKSECLGDGKYASLTDSQCKKPCSSPDLFKSDDKTCLNKTGCSAVSYYSDSIDKTCLKLSACQGKGKLGKLDTFDCVSTCPTPFLKKPSDKTCISDAICKSSNLLIESASSSCLNPSECGNLNKLTSISTNECRSTCPTGLLKKDSSKSCVTPVECNSDGLFVNKKDSTCISSADCKGLPSFVNSIDKTCVDECDPLLSYVSQKTCIQQCNAGDFKDTSDLQCLTKAQCNSRGKLIVQSQKLCVSTCPTTHHYNLNGVCYSSCPSSHYHLTKPDSCVLECPLKKHSSVAKKCIRDINVRVESSWLISKTQIGLRVAFYFQVTPSPRIVTFSPSNPSAVLKTICLLSDASGDPICDGSQSAAQMVSGYLETTIESTKIAIETKKIEVGIGTGIGEFDQDGYWSQLAGPKAEGTISQTPLASPPKPSNTTDNPKPENPKPENQTTSSNQQKEQKILGLGITVAGLGALNQIISPLLMATFMDFRTGSSLCLLAQTYTKVMMMTHLEFDLGTNNYEDIYYMVFQDFLSSFNEKLIVALFGEPPLTRTRAYLCESGYPKLCKLDVESNAFVTHFLACLLTIFQAIIILGLILLLTLFRKQSWVKILKKKLVLSIIFAFLLENGIDFWFSLVINSMVFAFQSNFTVVLKGLGFFILGLFTVCLFLMLTVKTRRDLTKTKGTRWARTALNKFECLLSGLINDRHLSFSTKLLLFHDALFSFIVCLGKIIGGKAQCWIWVIMEIGLTFFLIRYNVFKEKIMYVRGILVESIFLGLSFSFVLVNHMNTHQYHLSGAVLALSLLILIIDASFMILETSKTCSQIIEMILCSKWPHNYKQQPEWIKMIIFQPIQANNKRPTKSVINLQRVPKTSNRLIVYKKNRVNILPSFGSTKKSIPKTNQRVVDGINRQTHLNPNMMRPSNLLLRSRSPMYNFTPSEASRSFQKFRPLNSKSSKGIMVRPPKPVMAPISLRITKSSQVQ